MRGALVAPAALAGALFVSGSGARADDAAAPPAARALYEEATRAMDARDFATACPKLEEVVRLVPQGVGARVTLGECYEGDGKLASAWSAYNAAFAVAARSGQVARADKARAAAAALRPRLATLTVDVAPEISALAGLSVERDGAPVGPASFGVAIPVDRGPHRVTASAAGHRPFDKRVDVQADGAEVKVVVDALAGEPASAAPVAAPGALAPRVELVAAPPTSPLVYVGFVTAGVGVGVGAVAGALTLSQASTCKSAGGCTTSALDQAKATAWISDIGLGVGVAGVALGVVGLLLRRPSKAADHAIVRIAPDGAGLGGAF